MKELFLRGPIVVSFFSALLDFYKSGVFECNSVTSSMFDDEQQRIIEAISSLYSPINHCALLVGWGTSDSGEEYWLVQNSQVVLNGVIRIKRGTNECGIESMIDVIFPDIDI
jgi:hypothetical protein